jgi:peptidoglycan/LPS O-acetylase OafA/YrhL
LTVDALKAVAAQCIVLHHFAWYGPLSEQAALLWSPLEGLIGGFATYGRYAVAVFLVVGGYLSALALSAQGLPANRTSAQLMFERYLRLIVPFAVALLFAIACNLLARQWMQHDSLGSAPQWSQLLAHLLLLHNLLGVESLSAGVWYVAIDFKLYALFVLLLWLGQRGKCRHASADFWPVALVVLCGLAALFFFNRDDAWDATPLYFFGAYSLGIAAGWAQRSARLRPVLWGLLAAVAIALLVEFRERLAVAACTALLLAGQRSFSVQGSSALLAYLSRTSYALFLVHFPVYQLVSAIFVRVGWDEPARGLLGLGIAWVVSLVAADLLNRHIEQPFERWRMQRLACASLTERTVPRRQHVLVCRSEKKVAVTPAPSSASGPA